MLSQNIYYCSASENSRSILNIILENLTKGKNYLSNFITNNKIILSSLTATIVGTGIVYYFYNKHQKRKMKEKKRKKLEQEKLQEKLQKKFHERNLKHIENDLDLLLKNRKEEDKKKYYYCFIYNFQENTLEFLEFLELGFEKGLRNFKEENKKFKINRLLITSCFDKELLEKNENWNNVNDFLKKLLKDNKYQENEVIAINEFIDSWSSKFFIEAFKY
jgi:hypothetical protein